MHHFEIFVFTKYSDFENKVMTLFDRLYMNSTCTRSVKVIKIQ